MLRQVGLSLALLPLFSLLYFLAGFSTPHDADLGYHLSIGEIILNTKSFPISDLFRFDSNEQEIAYSWLPAITLYLLEQWGGVQGLKVWVIGSIFVLTLSLALLISGRRSVLFSAFILGLSSLCFLQIFQPRPRLWATILFCLLLYVLRSDFVSATRQGALKRTASIFIVTVFWANSHISVFLAPIVVLIFSASCWLQKQVHYKMAYSLLFVIVSLSAIIVNPYGIKIFTFLIDFSPLGHKELSGMIYELASVTTFKDNLPIWVWTNASLFAVWVFLIAAILYSYFAKKQSLPNDFLGACLITGMLAIVAFNSTRHATLFSVSALFAISCSPLKPIIVNNAAKFLGVVIFIFSIGLGYYHSGPYTKWYDPKVSAGFYPIAALETLEPVLEKFTQDNKQWSVLTPFGNGHFTTWWLRKNNFNHNALVFLDGRIDGLGRKRFFIARDVYEGNCWKETLDFYQINIVLVNDDAPLFEILGEDKDWAATGGEAIVSYLRLRDID
jgi:hypothetical protein